VAVAPYPGGFLVMGGEIMALKFIAGLIIGCDVAHILRNKIFVDCPTNFMGFHHILWISLKALNKSVGGLPST